MNNCAHKRRRNKAERAAKARNADAFITAGDDIRAAVAIIEATGAPEDFLIERLRKLAEYFDLKNELFPYENTNGDPDGSRVLHV